MFRSLQNQWLQFFVDWDADRVEVGEKIAEGAQGEICAMRILGEREHGEVDMDSWTVLKVFKQG